MSALAQIYRIPPSKLILESVQLPMFELKRLTKRYAQWHSQADLWIRLRGRVLHRYKIGGVFTENERVLSSSSMDENILDDKARIE